MKSDKELFRLVATIGHTYRDDAAELAAESERSTRCPAFRGLRSRHFDQVLSGGRALN